MLILINNCSLNLVWSRLIFTDSLLHGRYFLFLLRVYFSSICEGSSALVFLIFFIIFTIHRINSFKTIFHYLSFDHIPKISTSSKPTNQDRMQCSAVVVTSPCRVHPSTQMLESVLSSLDVCVQNFNEGPVVIVCDGIWNHAIFLLQPCWIKYKSPTQAIILWIRPGKSIVSKGEKFLSH